MVRDVNTAVPLAHMDHIVPICVNVHHMPPATISRENAAVCQGFRVHCMYMLIFISCSVSLVKLYLTLISVVINKFLMKISLIIYVCINI